MLLVESLAVLSVSHQCLMLHGVQEHLCPLLSKDLTIARFVHMSIIKGCVSV